MGENLEAKTTGERKGKGCFLIFIINIIIFYFYYCCISQERKKEQFRISPPVHEVVLVDSEGRLYEGLKTNK